jgi:hypothetical protein
MTTRDVFIWELLDRSPFLRSYLIEIEQTNSTDTIAAELLTFYRELDEMIDEVLSSELSVISHQSSVSDKAKVLSDNNQEVV